MYGRGGIFFSSQLVSPVAPWALRLRSCGEMSQHLLRIGDFTRITFFSGFKLNACPDGSRLVGAWLWCVLQFTRRVHPFALNPGTRWIRRQFRSQDERNVQWHRWSNSWRRCLVLWDTQLNWTRLLSLIPFSLQQILCIHKSSRLNSRSECQLKVIYWFQKILLVTRIWSRAMISW